jgi:hypothetical protein
VFRIKKGGAVTIEGFGFKGEECLDAARTFMEKLGDVASQVKKPEYHEIPYTESVVKEEEAW